MTVFVVMRGGEYDSYIGAIFSTRTRAAEYGAEVAKVDRDDADIEEWELDAEVLTRAVLVFTCTVSADGRLAYGQQQRMAFVPPNTVGSGRRMADGCYHGLSYVSAEDATEQARAARTAWHAAHGETA